MVPVLRGERGLTLIELLIAVAISAIILTVVYQTFNGIMDSAVHIEETAEMDRMARLTLGMISDEIRSAFWKPLGPTGQWAELIFEGIDGPGGEHPSDSLVFSAFSPWISEQGTVLPNLSIIAYNLEPAAREEEFVLYHLEDTNPLSGSADVRQRYELAEHVSGLNFRYYDGEDWYNEWDAAIENKLPIAVEIAVYFRTSSGMDRRFITTADLP
ncbi:MAG TPA: prepilin-type N-terminal cleavage/methylation domain-containing protein, partial [Nitrospiria bacterium]|nr:prepilin-type N-terminal cleavage/methylation domain-containing protein [Nitrospiria bacterium]